MDFLNEYLAEYNLFITLPKDDPRFIDMAKNIPRRYAEVEGIIQKIYKGHTMEYSKLTNWPSIHSCPIQQPDYPLNQIKSIIRSIGSLKEKAWAQYMNTGKQQLSLSTLYIETQYIDGHECMVLKEELNSSIYKKPEYHMYQLSEKIIQQKLNTLQTSHSLLEKENLELKNANKLLEDQLKRFEENKQKEIENSVSVLLKIKKLERAKKRAEKIKL